MLSFISEKICTTSSKLPCRLALSTYIQNRRRKEVKPNQGSQVLQRKRSKGTKGDNRPTWTTVTSLLEVLSIVTLQRPKTPQQDINPITVAQPTLKSEGGEEKKRKKHISYLGGFIRMTSFSYSSATSLEIYPQPNMAENRGTKSTVLSEQRDSSLLFWALRTASLFAPPSYGSPYIFVYGW